MLCAVPATAFERSSAEIAADAQARRGSLGEEFTRQPQARDLAHKLVNATFDRLRVALEATGFDLADAPTTLYEQGSVSWWQLLGRRRVRDNIESSQAQIHVEFAVRRPSDGSVHAELSVHVFDDEAARRAMGALFHRTLARMSQDTAPTTDAQRMALLQQLEGLVEAHFAQDPTAAQLSDELNILLQP